MNLAIIETRCIEAAYRVLGNPKTSRITQNLDDTGRETVAQAIAAELLRLLDQPLPRRKPDDRGSFTRYGFKVLSKKPPAQREGE